MKHPVKTRTELVSTTIGTLYDVITLRLSAAVASWIEFDLTFAQLKALLVLSRRGDLALGELAEGLGIGNSAASILVQQLVSRGLVDRGEDAHDRRRSVLCLSERGARLVAGRRKEREAQLNHWLAPLSDDELQGLARGLSILHDRMLESVPHVHASGNPMPTQK
jgi:DNA-binding MarR family transcriptional regulator